MKSNQSECLGLSGLWELQSAFFSEYEKGLGWAEEKEGPDDSSIRHQLYPKDFSWFSVELDDDR